jgi:Asp-tRNA(Asn)/Glu-tRNA(Gln) amidotransferase C subunit
MLNEPERLINEQEQLNEILIELSTLNGTLDHVETHLEDIITILSKVYNIDMAEIEKERISRQR